MLPRSFNDLSAGGLHLSVRGFAFYLNSVFKAIQGQKQVGKAVPERQSGLPLWEMLSGGVETGFPGWGRHATARETGFPGQEGLFRGRKSHLPARGGCFRGWQTGLPGREGLFFGG